MTVLTRDIASWPDIKRLLSKIVIADGCIIWTGGAGRRGQGYGDFILQRDGKRTDMLVHRFAYEAAYGRRLDPSETLDHLCHVPLCINPNHLAIATHSENAGRRRPRGLIVPPPFRHCVPLGCGFKDTAGNVIGIDDHHPRLDGWKGP